MARNNGFSKNVLFSPGILDCTLTGYLFPFIFPRLTFLDLFAID